MLVSINSGSGGAPARLHIPAELTAEALAETNLASDGQRCYTVAAGDSLAYLAHRFYGEAIEYQRLFEANRDKLASPNLIRIGQQLRVPG